MIIAFFATTRCVDGACYPNQLCSSPPAVQKLSEEFPVAGLGSCGCLRYCGRNYRSITGKLILVPKPPLPSSYPSEARQESRAGGLGPAAHRNSYEVVTTYRRGASHHYQERYGAQDNLTSLTGKLSLIELLLYLLKSSKIMEPTPGLLRPK